MTDDVKTGETKADETKKAAGRKGFGVNFKVSAKGAVSVYGLGRFPVTLYREQWLRLLERTDDLKKFLDEHAGELAKKGEAPAGEPSAEGPAGLVTATPATAVAAHAEGAAEQTAEAASPATTLDEAGAGTEDQADGDADTPPDDYDGLS